MDPVAVRKDKARPSAKRARRAAVKAALQASSAAGPRKGVACVVGAEAHKGSEEEGPASASGGDGGAAGDQVVAKVVVKKERPCAGERPYFPGAIVPRGYKWLEVAATPARRLLRVPSPCAAAVLCVNRECNHLHFCEKYVRNRGGIPCPECGTVGALGIWFLDPPTAPAV